MAKNLIIVESPAKTRTLKKFLGPSYDIRASMGHVRDLPESKFGVDLEHGFKPTYVVPADRRDTIKDLKAAAEKATNVYLASDPDREGEAIAWHLSEALGLKEPRRIQFNEITERAVKDALAHPRTLNQSLFNAQQARRVLDRVVGYKISPLLGKKVQRGLSAGRVQSVAVRLVVEREREIEAFVPVEYWSLTALLTPLDQHFPFEAKLVSHLGKKLELKDEPGATAVVEAVRNAEWRVREVKQQQRRRNPAAPFITSTFQQEASRKLGMNPRRAMRVAQDLYEGVDLGAEGSVGLITYMRTDSTHLSQEARDMAREFITAEYGPEFYAGKQYASRAGAQEAHEAIRPTGVTRKPADLKDRLTSEQFRVYQLIWQRFVASQMSAAIYDVTTAEIQAGEYGFRAVGSVLKFAGFTRVYTEGRDDAAEQDEEKKPLPPLTPEQLLKLLDLLPRQHFTEPPPRYTEASLVKALEENGIGRPSTYASIISTIQDRGYVVSEEKRLKPTPLGCTVNDLLVKHFPQVLDIKFTAGMEGQLDDVAKGDRDWVALMEQFYGPFSEALSSAAETMENLKPQPVETDQPCPNCGRPLLLRTGRFGPFLGCSGYPECKTIVKVKEEADAQAADDATPLVDCPKCKEGQVTARKSRTGKTFYGCNRYPECDFATWDKPLPGTQCDTCGAPLGENTYRGRVIGTRCINMECPTNAEAAAARAARAESKGSSRRGGKSTTRGAAAKSTKKTTARSTEAKSNSAKTSAAASPNGASPNGAASKDAASNPRAATR